MLGGILSIIALTLLRVNSWSDIILYKTLNQ